MLRASDRCSCALRPGPRDYIPNYIAGMQNVHNIEYPTPEVIDILRPTYGVIVYQEQVMQIVQKLAGYTLGRADKMRKAMGGGYTPYTRLL